MKLCALFLTLLIAHSSLIFAEKDKVSFFEREQKKREHFFSCLPNLSNKINPISLLQDILTKAAPLALPLDGPYRHGDTYSHYADQFYRILLRTSSLTSEFSIRVCGEGKVIYEEVIALPLKGSKEWNAYLIEDGMVSIPETILKTKFGLDIRVRGLLDKTLLVDVKGHSHYRFSIVSADVPLYTFEFIESPPWQLGALLKPTVPTCPPFLENGPFLSFDSINQSAKLNPGVELAEHPLLDQFVLELKNDPLAIAQYVQNEIDFVEPFLRRTNSGAFYAPPFHRSASGTFLEGQGSPWEQCALLVYLLRKAGYNAIYAQANCSLPCEYVERLLQLQLPQKRDEILQYPFVMLKIDKKWISLFPWMKNVQVTEGHDLYQLMSDEYSSAERWLQRYLCNDPEIFKHINHSDDSTGVLFSSFVTEQLKNQGLSLEDVGIDRKIIKQSFTKWEEFPRPYLSHFKCYENLDSNENSDLFAFARVTISSKEHPEKRISERWPLPLLSSRALAIDFEEHGGGQQVMRLTLNDEKEGALANLGLKLNQTDHNLDLEISYEQPLVSRKTTLSFTKGTRAALWLSSGGGSERNTSYFASQYLKTSENEGSLHKLLAYMGALYFEKCTSARKILSKLHKLPYIVYFDCGLSKLAPEKTGPAFIKQEDLCFPQVDMVFYAYQPPIVPFSKDQSDHLPWSQLYALLNADFSSNEHQVIREVFKDQHAISTIKLLQIAHKAHQGKQLEGLGFLALTDWSLKGLIKGDTDCFSHLPGFSLQNVYASGKFQWEKAKSFLEGQSHSIAYMTPGPISSLDHAPSKAPSYCGMGTLILGHEKGAALISDSGLTMNGGFGSRIDKEILSLIKTKQWNPFPVKSDYQIDPSIVFSSKYSNKSALQSMGQVQQKTSEKITPTMQVDRWVADVRLGFRDGIDTVADPVDIVSGAFYIDEVDLTLPGPFPLQIRRNYNSQNPFLTSLGHGWKLSLNPELFEEDDKLYATEEDGTVIIYRYQPELSKWTVQFEDNPNLHNFNSKGIGSTATPFHAYIQKDWGHHLLYGSDGSKRIYRNKRLQSWTNPAGHTLWFRYDKHNNLTQIESLNGSYIGFCYNHEGKIAEAYAKDGRRIYYQYNSTGDLKKVVFPNGAFVEYTYDPSHQIVRETKSHGRVLENTYDEKGRVIKQRSPVGPQQEMVVSASFLYGDGVTIAIDASGASTEYKIFENQIYKIADPLGFITLQSWFIDANSYFDAEKESVIFCEQLAGHPRSLKSTQDKRGLITEYRYDNKGNPIEISLIGEDLTGQGDQQITKYLSYNEHNLLVEERMVNKVTRTTYDKQFPHLIKLIENFIDQTPLSFIEFEYTGGLLTQENRSGSITHWTYDRRGFPILIAQDNMEISYRYNEEGQCIEKRTVDGIERSVYDIMGNRLEHSLLDLSGNVLSTSYAGYNLNNQIAWQQGPDLKNTLYLDYNANGQLKVSRQSLTSIEGTEIIPAGFAYRLYDYDTRGHLTEEVNPLGYCTYRKYDALGRLSKETLDGLTIQFTYEAGGMVATMILPNGGKTTRLYTTNGLLKKEIYPDETESSFVYDFFGRPILQSSNGITWETAYDDANHTVIRTQKESGITEIRTFDARGNLLTLTDAEGYTWTKSYDLLNRVISETDPEGHTTTWSYERNTISCTLPNGETSIQKLAAGQLVETKTINTKGNLLAHTLFYYTPSQSKILEVSGSITSTTWTNTQGQPLRTQQEKLITTHQYDHAGRCIASTDGEGRITQQQYDQNGRVTKQILPDGTTLEFTYDEASNLIAYHLPDQITWQATYDLMGRKTSEALYANGQSTQNYAYTYENGLLKQAADPLGQVHHYTYDSALRLIAEYVENKSRTFTYDQRGLLTSAEQFGDEHAIVKRSYGPAGKLISEAISLNGQLLQQTDQTWTPSSRSLQIDDHRRDFHYEAGRLKSLSSNGLEFSYEYSLNGALTKKKTPFYSTDFSYNLSGLPHARKTLLGNELYQESLDWNLSGRLASYQSNTLEKAFTYTSRGHLKSAGQDQYACNSRGMRTSAPEHTIPPTGLDPFGNILTDILKGKINITTYNQMGQTLSRTTSNGKEQFEWDPWGNLIAIFNPSYNWKASYDALGRRLQTTYTQKGIFWSTSTQTTSLFDPEHEFQEIGVKYNNKTFWKLYGSSLEAVIDDDGNNLALFHDALGNLKAILTPTNTHWIEELPSPYGPTGPPPNLQPNLLSFAKSHAWQGNRQDQTGLIHLGARHYDPKIGRFLSPDPVSFPTCLDLYTYANSDPINFRDPSGRFFSKAYETIVPPTISAAKGIIGGTVDFGLNTLHSYQDLALHIGIRETEFAVHERFAMMHDVAQSQAARQDFVGEATMRALSVSPSNGIYQTFRSGTTTTLEIGTLATGAYGLYRGMGGPALSTIAKKIPKFLKFPESLSFRKNIPVDNHACSYIGRKGWELINAECQPTRNSPAQINGRQYVNHAIDQMQNRGIPPSVVENAIQHGVSAPNKVAGRTQFYDSVNKISVVTENGEVVTVLYGELK